MTSNEEKILSVTDGADRPTNGAGCRVACTRLKKNTIERGKKEIVTEIREFTWDAEKKAITRDEGKTNPKYERSTHINPFP